MTISFKERVRVVLIQQAQIYNDRFLNKEYLIHSCKFKYHLFYVIAAKRDNFLHLTGVSTNLKANEFFNKCLDETLTEYDFDIGDSRQKGSVRRKINALPYALNLFNGQRILIEENFIKNRISCSFASSDNKCTLGFTYTRKAKPQTLLKGNELSDPILVDVIAVKNESEELFNLVYISNEDINLNQFPIKIK
jgi:hypothetical protein